LAILISLRALDPARNIARHYQIDVSTDLFGLWIVEYRWGRIGTAGQAPRRHFRQRAMLRILSMG
jgi:predicted DNA-binding WGR domain protein